MEKPSILLVDDNEEILEFIADDLDEAYHIFTAINGREALNVIRLETVHLVISDIMMSVMNGYELCKQIKSDFHYSHIPVILLTAKDTMQSKIQGLELGADAYIEKPFSPQHLRVQIANLLSNRNKIKEHFANSPLIHIKSIAYSKADEGFLDRLNCAIDKHLHDINLDVELLAEEMNMSRPTLYRKIKAISDLTPSELIQITRLKKAAELIAGGHYRISEVAELVGYTSQSNFGRNFLKQFGMSPSDFFNANKQTLKVNSAGL
jgi:two-component system cell cycle response regulator